MESITCGDSTASVIDRECLLMTPSRKKTCEDDVDLYGRYVAEPCILQMHQWYDLGGVEGGDRVVLPARTKRDKRPACMMLL